MKKLTVIIIIFLTVVGCKGKSDQQIPQPEKEVKKTSKSADELDIISYRLGFNAALVTLNDFPNADKDAMVQGLKDAFKDNLKPKYDDERFNIALAKYRKDRVRIDAKKRLPEFIKNEPVSKKFMEEQAKRKGVKEIRKGVLIEVIKKGQGEKITEQDLVKVNYKGWDAKGKLFDSSYKRKKPSVFNLQKFIEGLRIAFTEMKKGGKYMVFIPQKMGYGSTGFRNRVESGMALKFEIEILDIKRNAAKK